MALPAGRVGVAKDQVDEFGNITGGFVPENIYTKTQCDNKFETKTHANNTYQPKTIEVPLHMLGGSQLTVETSLHAIEDSMGTLQFRNNEGTPQVKIPNGEWTNFNNGGGGSLGFNIPDNLIQTTGQRLLNSGRATIDSGGYCIDPTDEILYVDVIITPDSSYSYFEWNLPNYVKSPSDVVSLCVVPVGTGVKGSCASVTYSDGCGFKVTGLTTGLSGASYRVYGQFGVSAIS